MDVDRVEVAPKVVSSLATLPARVDSQTAKALNNLLPSKPGRSVLLSVVQPSTAVSQAHPQTATRDVLSEWTTLATSLLRGQPHQALVEACTQLRQSGMQRFVSGLPVTSAQRQILLNKIGLGEIRNYGLPIMPELSSDASVTMLYQAGELFRMWYDHDDAYSALAARRLGAALLVHCLLRAQQGLLFALGQYQQQDSPDAVVIGAAFETAFGPLMRTALDLSELLAGERLPGDTDKRAVVWKFLATRFRLTDLLCNSSLRSLRSLKLFHYDDSDGGIHVDVAEVFGKDAVQERLTLDYLSLFNPNKLGAGFRDAADVAKINQPKKLHALRQAYLLDMRASGALLSRDLALVYMRFFACYILPLVYGVGWNPYLRLYDPEPFMRELFITGTGCVLPYFAAPLMGSNPASSGCPPRAFSLLEAIHAFVCVVSQQTPDLPLDIGLYMGPEIVKRYVEMLVNQDNIPGPDPVRANLWHDRFSGAFRPDYTVALIGKQLGCSLDQSVVKLLFPVGSGTVATPTNFSPQTIIRSFECASNIIRALDSDEHRLEASDNLWGPNAAAEFKKLSRASLGTVLYIFLGCDSPLTPLQLAFENPRACVYCIPTTSFARAGGVNTGFQTILWCKEMRDKLALYYDHSLAKRVEFNGGFSFDAVHSDPMFVYEQARSFYACSDLARDGPPTRVMFITNHWSAQLLHNVEAAVYYRWTQLFLRRCGTELMESEANALQRFCFITTQSHEDSASLGEFAILTANTPFGTVRIAPGAGVMPAAVETHSLSGLSVLYVTVHIRSLGELLDRAAVVNRRYVGRSLPGMAQMEYLQRVDDATRRGEALGDAKNAVAREAAAFSIVRPLLNETQLLLRNSMFLLKCAELAVGSQVQLEKLVFQQIADQLASVAEAVCAARVSARSESAFKELQLTVLNTLSELSATALTASLERVSAQFTETAEALNSVSTVRRSAVSASVTARINDTPMASLDAASPLDCVMTFAAQQVKKEQAAPQRPQNDAALKEQMRTYGAGLIDLYSVFTNVKFINQQSGGSGGDDCMSAFAQLAQTFIAYITQLTDDLKENIALPWNQQDAAAQDQLKLDEDKRANFFDDRFRYSDYLVKRFRDPFHAAWKRAMTCLYTLASNTRSAVSVDEMLPAMVYLQMINNLINSATYLMSRRLTTKALRSHFAYHESLVLEQIADAHLFTQAQARKLQALMFYEYNWIAPFTASEFGALGYKFLVSDFDPEMFHLLVDLMHSEDPKAQRLISEVEKTEEKRLKTMGRQMVDMSQQRLKESTKTEMTKALETIKKRKVPVDMKPEDQLMTALSEIISGAMFDSSVRRMSVPPFLFMLNAGTATGSETTDTGKRLLTYLKRIGALLYKKSNQDARLLLSTSSHIVSFMVRAYSVLGPEQTLRVLDKLYSGIEAVDELDDEALELYFASDVTAAHSEFASVTTRYKYRIPVDSVRAVLEFTGNQDTWNRIKEMPDVIHGLSSFCAGAYYIPQDVKAEIKEGDENEENADDSSKDEDADEDVQEGRQQTGDKRKAVSSSSSDSKRTKKATLVADTKSQSSDAEAESSLEYRSRRDYTSTIDPVFGKRVNELVVQSSNESEEIVFATEKLSAEQEECVLKIFAATYVHDALLYCKQRYYDAHTVAIVHGTQNPNLASAAPLIMQFITPATPLARRRKQSKDTFLTALGTRWYGDQITALTKLREELLEYIETDEGTLAQVPFQGVLKALFDKNKILDIFGNLLRLLQASAGAVAEIGDPEVLIASFGMIVTYFFRLWMLCAVLNEISAPKITQAVQTAFPQIAATAKMSTLWASFYALGFTSIKTMPPFNQASLLSTNNANPSSLSSSSAMASQYDPRNWLSVTNRVQYSDAARYYAVLYAVCSQYGGAEAAVVTRATQQQFIDRTSSVLLEDQERRVIALLEHATAITSSIGQDPFFIAEACTQIYDLTKKRAQQTADAIEQESSFKWLDSAVSGPFDTVSLQTLYLHASRKYSKEIGQRARAWKDRCDADQLSRVQAWRRSIFDATNLLCHQNTLSCLSTYYGLRTPSWNTRLYQLADSQFFQSSGTAHPLDVAELFVVQFGEDLKTARQEAATGDPNYARSIEINKVISDAEKYVLESTQSAYRSAVKLIFGKAQMDTPAYAAGALASVLATGLLSKNTAKDAINLFSGLAVADFNKLTSFPRYSGDYGARKTEVATYTSLQLDSLSKATHKHLLAIEAAQLMMSSDRLLLDRSNTEEYLRLFQLMADGNPAVFGTPYKLVFDPGQSIAVTLENIRDFTLALARLHAAEEELVEVVRADIANIADIANKDGYERLFQTLFDFFALDLQFTYPTKAEKADPALTAAFSDAPTAPRAPRGKKQAAPRKRAQ